MRTLNLLKAPGSEESAALFMHSVRNNELAHGSSDFDYESSLYNSSERPSTYCNWRRNDIFEGESRRYSKCSNSVTCTVKKSSFSQVRQAYLSCMRECDANEDAWVLGRAFAFSFSIVTVLGYGSLQVLTLHGKVDTDLKTCCAECTRNKPLSALLSRLCVHWHSIRHGSARQHWQGDDSGNNDTCRDYT